MATQSAGILLHRGSPPEIFLIHMGGPLWARKDQAAWSIPKGMLGENEDALTAAKREFFEETGFTAQPPFLPLGRFRQNSSKDLTVWAAKGDCDPAKLVSASFSLEWPPRSGHFREFPEADRGAWWTQALARRKIVKDQLPALDRFYALCGI